MELDVFIRNDQKPLPEASVTLRTIALRSGFSSLQAEGPLAHFMGLEPALYSLKAEAEGHKPQNFMLSLKNSGRLDIELEERR